jgi:hypothetical protein
MKIRLSLMLTLALLIILCSCAIPSEVSPISSPNFTSTDPALRNTPSPVQPTTLVQSTPTVTPEEEVIMMTSEPPEIILTALNLQLQSNSTKLTEAAQQIAAMATESSGLKTQIALVATNASGNTSNQNSNSNQYNIPSNVYTVVTVDKAVIFEAKSYNKAGAPIMQPYEPRVFLPPGSEAWVYKKQVKADGGEIYYESYDPDGQSKLTVYFRSKHIQIRIPNGNPDPDNFPPDVAKALITDNTALFVIKSYDNAGKPIMETYKPAIRYRSGQTEIVYPEFLVGTGGTHWYPVYDPDGKPSGYIRSIFISFPKFWD